MPQAWSVSSYGFGEILVWVLYAKIFGCGLGCGVRSFGTYWYKKIALSPMKEDVLLGF